MYLGMVKKLAWLRNIAHFFVLMVSNKRVFNDICHIFIYQWEGGEGANVY